MSWFCVATTILLNNFSSLCFSLRNHSMMLDREMIDERWIVVHLNELTEEDFARLERGPRFHIAHCPRSSRYFRHAPFALRRLTELGFNICLGTDSLASNLAQPFRRNANGARCASVARPGTHPGDGDDNGARALHQGKSLGKIRAGFQADLIALPIENPAATSSKKSSLGTNRCRGCSSPGPRASALSVHILIFAFPFLIREIVSALRIWPKSSSSTTSRQWWR